MKKPSSAAMRVAKRIFGRFSDGDAENQRDVELVIAGFIDDGFAPVVEALIKISDTQSTEGKMRNIRGGNSDIAIAALTAWKAKR